MQKKHINRLLRTTGTIAAFGLLLYQLRRQGWSEILESVAAIPPWRFAAAIVLILVSRLVVAVRWHVLLQTAGQPIRLSDSLRITFSGLFASNFLPTTIGGDVVRLAMALRMGYDNVVATASLVVDRLVGVAGMATAAPLGLIPLFGGLSSGPVAAGAFGAFSSRVGNIRARLWEALHLWMRSPRGLLLAFAWTWAHQLALFGVVWLMLGGLGEPPPFWLVGGLWSLTYFVTLLPVSINGLGLQELSMTAIFTGLGGVSVGAAATAALLVRTLQTLASLPGALFLPDILSGGRPPEGEAP
ncbi:MAG TPA: lysylphosphatidylglycerol synthase transmembrane domain-containing protein [Anaerolineales bacterium]|nr:lysylphosphatidylglycerol synthase transmembrane domain-containing protein [Anaerolineales bacterium]